MPQYAPEAPRPNASPAGAKPSGSNRSPFTAITAPAAFAQSEVFWPRSPSAVEISRSSADVRSTSTMCARAGIAPSYRTTCFTPGYGVVTVSVTAARAGRPRAASASVSASAHATARPATDALGRTSAIFARARG